MNENLLATYVLAKLPFKERNEFPNPAGVKGSSTVPVLNFSVESTALPTSHEPCSCISPTLRCFNPSLASKAG